MIGAQFKDGDATYEVVGAEGGAWVVNRTDTFAPPERLTSADIASKFNTAAPAAPERRSDEEGWKRLSEANARVAARQAYRDHPEDFKPEPGTPEHDTWRRRVAAANAAPAPTPEELFRASDAEGRRVGVRQ